jgi:phage terminase Nu1 subunit (DNA packaging protein)
VKRTANPSDLAAKARAKEVRNIVAKLNAGKTLTVAERRILEENQTGEIKGGAKYTVSALNQITGYDRRTLGRVLGDMRSEHSIREVIEAFRAHERLRGKPNGDIDPEYEKARKDREIADKYAIANAQRRGELLEASDVERVWLSRITAAKTRLMGIPRKCAPAVVMVTAPADAEAIIEQEVRDALEELAKG